MFVRAVCCKDGPEVFKQEHVFELLALAAYRRPRFLRQLVFFCSGCSFGFTVFEILLLLGAANGGAVTVSQMAPHAAGVLARLVA